jgi:hypothetical protein
LPLAPVRVETTPCSDSYSYMQQICLRTAAHTRPNRIFSHQQRQRLDLHFLFLYSC